MVHHRRPAGEVQRVGGLREVKSKQKCFGNFPKHFCLLDIQFWWEVDLVGDVFAVLFALAHALGEEIFDLPVHRAEVVLGPGSKGVVELRVQAQRDLLFAVSAISVKAAAVHDGLGVPVAAEHHHEIRDHGRLPLIVQLHHLVLAQAVQSHLHHAHGTVHDHLPGVDDGAGLLALEHHGCDLRAHRPDR